MRGIEIKEIESYDENWKKKKEYVVVANSKEEAMKYQDDNELVKQLITDAKNRKKVHEESIKNLDTIINDLQNGKCKTMADIFNLLKLKPW